MTPVAIRRRIIVTGCIGLVASILVGIGEYLLNYVALARYSETNYDCLFGISELL